MGTNDQDNDTPQPPVEQQPDMDPPNQSQRSMENGDSQPPRYGGQGRNDGSSQQHRQKRRVARRKIRVELIKEPADHPEDGADGMGEEVAPDGQASASAVPPGPVTMPVTGGAYA